MFRVADLGGYQAAGASEGRAGEDVVCGFGGECRLHGGRFLRWGGGSEGRPGGMSGGGGVGERRDWGQGGEGVLARGGIGVHWGIRDQTMRKNDVEILAARCLGMAAMRSFLMSGIIRRFLWVVA